MLLPGIVVGIGFTKQNSNNLKLVLKHPWF